MMNENKFPVGSLEGVAKQTGIQSVDDAAIDGALNAMAPQLRTPMTLHEAWSEISRLANDNCPIVRATQSIISGDDLELTARAVFSINGERGPRCVEAIGLPELVRAVAAAVGGG